MSELSEEAKSKIIGFQSGAQEDGRWWHRGNEDFEALATQLVLLGLSEAAAIRFLEKVYKVVANEYGE